PPGVFVERWGQGWFGLGRACRRKRLVLVVDASRRSQRGLEPLRPYERRRAPHTEDVEHFARDVDPRVGRYLLRDETHRKERREIVGAARLAGRAMRGPPGRARARR